VPDSSRDNQLDDCDQYGRACPQNCPVTPTNPADTGDVSQLADLTKSQRVKKLRGNTQRADRLIGVWQTAAFRRLAARASRGSVSKWI
jgi:hypothetical protein